VRPIPPEHTKVLQFLHEEADGISTQASSVQALTMSQLAWHARVSYSLTLCYSLLLSPSYQGGHTSWASY